MSKTQQVKAIAAQRSKAISEQINELRQLQNNSVESLAQQIEPLAQALAALSEESREAILQLVKAAAQQQRKSAAQWQQAAEKWSEATGSLKRERQALRQATEQISTASSRSKKQLRGVTWKIWIAAISTGTLIALALLSAYMLWQPPLSSGERAAVKYFNAIAPEHKQQIIETVKRNNL